MYMLKVSYGYVDEPETATTDMIGAYKTLDEACEVAASKFDAIKGLLCNDLEIRFGELSACLDNYYVTYGYLDPEFGRAYAGYDHYYYISVVER